MEASNARTKTLMHAFVVAAVAALALVVAMSFGVGRAYAGGGGFAIGEIQTKTIGLSYDKKSEWWSTYSFYAKKDVTNAKSSKPKVAKVKANGTWLTIVAKKAGKTKITYKVGGKTHKVNVVVKKYKNPFKSFLVGKDNCVKGFKKQCTSSTTSVKGYNIVGKVKIKPAKNWKLKKINAYTENGMKKIKNGAKLPAGTSTIQVFMVNKKTKVWQRAYVYGNYE